MSQPCAGATGLRKGDDFSNESEPEKGQRQNLLRAENTPRMAERTWAAAVCLPVGLSIFDPCAVYSDPTFCHFSHPLVPVFYLQ